MKTFEISSKRGKNGRRPFKAILLEIHPESCVKEDKTGELYNDNGITWLEKFLEDKLDTIHGMSVTVEFADSERVEIIGHGATGIVDGIPTFNDATVVGVFEKGYITDIETEDSTKRVLIGEGTFDEMRYKPFVDSIQEKLDRGEFPQGSIEIYKTPENDSIIYYGEPVEFGRIPMEFLFSGWSILGITPADKMSAVIELNNKKNKEESDMNESTLNAFIESIKNTIVETNSHDAELNQKLSEANEAIAQKDGQISELNASVEQIQNALADMEAEKNTYWEELELLRKELAKAKVAQRLSEMNKAISEFSEEDRKFAEEEIKAFEADPMNVEINSIVSKIKTCAYDRIMNAKKVAEQNSKKNESKLDDIFGEVMDDIDAPTTEDSIF